MKRKLLLSCLILVTVGVLLIFVTVGVLVKHGIPIHVDPPCAFWGPGDLLALDFRIVDTSGNLVPDAHVQVRTEAHKERLLPQGQEANVSRPHFVCQAGKCEVRDLGHGAYTEYTIHVSRDGFQPKTVTVRVPAEANECGGYTPIPQSAEIVLQPMCNADKAMATLTMSIADTNQNQVPHARASYLAAEGEWQQAQCTPSDVAYHCVFDLAGVNLPAELPLRVEASRFELFELSVGVQVGENNCPFFVERRMDLAMVSVCEESPPVLVNPVVDSLGRPAYAIEVTYSVDGAPEQLMACAYDEGGYPCPQYRLDPTVPGDYTIYVRPFVAYDETNDEPITTHLTIPADERDCPVVDRVEPIELMIDSLPEVLFTDAGSYCAADLITVSVPVRVLLPHGRSADELHLSYQLGSGEWQPVNECTGVGDEVWCYLDLPQPLWETVTLRGGVAGTPPITRHLLDPLDVRACGLYSFWQDPGGYARIALTNTEETCDDICVIFGAVSDPLFELDLTN